MKFETIDGGYISASCSTCRSADNGSRYPLILYDSMIITEKSDLMNALIAVYEHKRLHPKHQVEITIDSTWEPVLDQETEKR